MGREAKLIVRWTDVTVSSPIEIHYTLALTHILLLEMSFFIHMKLEFLT